jgi:DNA topoisomerase-1
VIKGIYLPPAHDKVQITRNRSAKILAIGYDIKGRTQYTYNPAYISKQSKSKFNHMVEFGESYKKIMSQIHQDINQAGDYSKEKQIALILRLVIDCGFRIGNDKYTKENKSFGVSTLESHHVKLNGSQVTVDFRGKKGVQNRCPVKNPKLRKELRTKKRHSGKRGRLFTYRKGSTHYHVKSSDVNRYLKTFGDFTTKNFRTWNANIHFIQHLVKADLDIDSTEAHKNKTINDALDSVAHRLHNTRSVCKSNYVDPYLLDVYLTHPKRFQDAFHGSTTKEDITEHYIQLLKRPH